MIEAAEEAGLRQDVCFFRGRDIRIGQFRHNPDGLVGPGHTVINGPPPYVEIIVGGLCCELLNGNDIRLVTRIAPEERPAAYPAPTMLPYTQLV